MNHPSKGNFLFTILASVLVCGDAKSQTAEKEFAVDLSDEQVDPRALQDLSNDGQTQGKAWYERVQVWGHVAADYLDSGRTGFRPEGAFMLREAQLFVRAHASDRVSATVELDFARAGVPDDKGVRAGEVYIEIRDVIPGSPELLNFKIGSMDIPFGEEYTRRDAIDYPTINYSAGIPYGVDEGVTAFGEFEGVHWAAALMDGNCMRSVEDNAAKSIAVKLSGEPTEHLYLSASGMNTGRSAFPANCFGGMYLAPVGSDGLTSSAGATPSKEISAALYEFDAILRADGDTYLMGQFGQAFIDDDASQFDRDLTWFFLEGSIGLTDHTYLAARYSEFGTYDSNKGYRINGKLTGAGAAAFGWDTKRL